MPQASIMGLILSLVSPPCCAPTWAPATSMGQMLSGLETGLAVSALKGSPGTSVCSEGQPAPGSGSDGLISTTFSGSTGAWVSPEGQVASGEGLGPVRAQAAPPPGTKATRAKAL